MDLFLLRHAQAVEADVWDGSERTRPLDEHGHKQAAALGAHVSRIGFSVDAILSSPLTRALETAGAVAAALGLTVEHSDLCGPGFGPRRLGDLLAQRNEDRLLLCGHNPDLERVTLQLSGGARMGFGKGMLVRFKLRRGEIDDAELKWVLPPSAYLPA